MPLHRRTRDWYVELDSNQHTCDVNASGNLSHHRRIGLARVVGIEPTCTGFKAQTDLHVIPQLFWYLRQDSNLPSGLRRPKSDPSAEVLFGRAARIRTETWRIKSPLC